MTTTETAANVGPATLVDCAWCEAPVELAGDADTLDCPTCRLTVDLAPGAPPAEPPDILPSAA